MTNTATKRQGPRKKSQARVATATKKKLPSRKTPRERAAAIIKLAPKHRRELKRLTKGAVDSDTILLRPDLDLGAFLAKIAELAKLPPEWSAGGPWKNPNGGMWV